MTFVKRLLMVFTVPVLIALMGLGCSDKTFTSATNDVSESASPLAYIPLEQGLRVDYALIDEGQTRYFELEVTDPVTVLSNAGYEIRRTDRVTNETSAVYRYVKDNAIFETSSLSDPGYRILDGPFVAGHSWSRYDNSSSSTTVTYGDNGEDANIGKNGVTLWGDSYKILPDENFGIMMIVGFEDVNALNGVNYGSCLKVAWQIDPQRTNYYWYCSGIGLVKFEQVSIDLNVYDDPISIIMTDYQMVEY